MNSVEESLLALPTWSRSVLLERWQAIYHRPPPSHSRAELLRRVIGWHLQADAYGGLDSTTRLKLRRSTAGIQLVPGTQLIRVWQGVSHKVTVLDAGFSYQDQVWRSLSAIARSITGTSWNGKVFFGVGS